MLDILTELEDRLQSVYQRRRQLQQEQKEHSRKASDIQESLIKLDGEEKLLKELHAVIKLKGK